MSPNPHDGHHQTWNEIPHFQKRQEDAEALRSDPGQRQGESQLAAGDPDPLEDVVHRGHGWPAGPEGCGGPQASGYPVLKALPDPGFTGEPAWRPHHVHHQLQAQMCQQHPVLQGRTHPAVGH